MALAVADRVKETSTTAGTGTLTLLGAVSGYQSFSVIGSGNTTYYCIVDDNTGQWEVGVGTYTSPNQLSRDTVLSSSSGGSAITFLGNIKQVFVTYPAERSVYENAAGSLVLSKVEATTGIITNLTSTSAVLTNVSATSATVTNLTLTSLTISSLSITNLSAASATITTGNLTFSSTGQRITGDFTNATFANRTYFQTSTTNGNTDIMAVPNGTGTLAQVSAWSSNDPANSSLAALRVTAATDVRILSSIQGTGTYLPMTFYTGGSERMRLDTSGNLGIGTASPQSKLNVVESSSSTSIGGSTAVLQVGNSYGAALNVSAGIELFGSGAPSSGLNNRSAGLYGVYEAYNASGNAGALVLATNPAGTTSVVERMRIDSSGNVGIGTVTPGAKLAVNGGAGTSQIRWNVSNATYVEEVATNAAANAYVFKSYDASYHVWKLSSSENMRLDSSGFLGLGTTPGFLFDAYNSSTAVDYVAGRFYSAAAASGESRTWLKLEKGVNYGGAVGGYLSQGVGSGLIFGTQNNASTPTERMRIDNNGNVGIGGTAGANEKLTLTGTLPTSSNTSKAISVQATSPSGSTSDCYVFESYPATQAAAFTLGSVQHFRAVGVTIGASSAITNQYGFLAGSTLTGATNNYGFYSNIASGSNRWNFFANGTAQNHMAGRLGIGNTTFVDNEMLRVTQANANTGVFIDITAASSTANAAISIRKQDNNNTTAQTYIAFAYNAGASGAGGIQGNGGTGPQFFNSSDARLKENVADLDGQLAKIMALKPRTFDFIDGPKGCTGFIAQEMEEIYPDAVGVSPDGYKTIGGVSIMEARLIKAIQELEAKVAALEAK